MISRVAWFWALLCVVGAFPTSAQEKSIDISPLAFQPGDSSPSVPTARPRKPDEKSLSEDYMYVTGPDGKLVLVPVSDWKDFLKWRDQQKATPKPDGYAFSSLTLTGKISGDNAGLTAELTIQVSRDEQSLKIPLGFNEAVLKKLTHTFQPTESTETPSAEKSQSQFAGFDPQGGYEWWLQGRGLHTLTLKIGVPLKKSGGVSRLQLSVPVAAGSSLDLEFPNSQTQLAFEPITAGSQKIQAPTPKTTKLELFRTGPKIDLQWRVLPDTQRVKTLIQAETEIRLEPTEESILLQARQLIEPLQGSMDHVEVTLPRDFEVVELKIDGRRFAEFPESMDTARKVTLPLPAATTERVRFDWILRADWDTSKPLMVDGFNVSDALRQSGEIGIVAFDGFRIAKQSGTDVYRTNVREILGPGTIASAYQFRQQPFQLGLKLEEIAPAYSIRPHVFLKIAGDEIQLLADLDLEVYRGVVDSLTIDWPGFEQQGWAIDRAELPGLVEQLLTDPNSSQLTFQLAKRLSQGTKLRIRLIANKPLIDEDRSDPFEVSLPRVVASTPVRTVVMVTHADNAETVFQPVAGTVVQPLSALLDNEVQSLLASPKLSDFRGARPNGFSIPSMSHQFQVDLTIHRQEIFCTHHLNLRVEDDECSVEHFLDYRVDYESISEVRLQLPESFPESLTFELDGVPLMLEEIAKRENGIREVRISLPDAQLGRFRLRTQYQTPFSRESSGQFEFPLIKAVDAFEMRGRIQFHSDEDLEPRLKSEGWIKSPTVGNTSVWQTETPGSVAEFSWTTREDSLQQKLTIPQSYLRTVVLPAGQISTRAYYQLPSGTRELTLEMSPDQFAVDRFLWNGEELTTVELLDEETGTFRLRFPEVTDDAEDAAKTDFLQIHFHSALNDASVWFQTATFYGPTFAGDVWVERTAWEFVLPVDQHLLTIPEGYIAGFDWMRDGVFWKRESLPHKEIADWLPASTESGLLETGLEGNRYVFRSFGSPPSARFSSMNRSMIVLLGAGLALLSGFVLMRLRVTRNIFTLLLTLFMFAVLGLWFTEAMQVLLQPCLLGLLLAAVGVWVDSRFKSRQRDKLSPFPETHDYSGSSYSRPPALHLDPIGSEDPTAVRTAGAKSSTETGNSKSGQEAAEKRMPAEAIGSSHGDAPQS